MTAQRLSDRPWGRTEQDAIDAEAIAIIVLLLSGVASASDAAAIRAWRKRSEAHEAGFACAVRTWRGLALAARADIDAPTLAQAPSNAFAAPNDRLAG